MKPITVVSAVLIVFTALTLGLVIALKTPYLSSIVEKEKREEVCAQVLTRAIDPVSGEVKEFSTPCDVPQGWEIVPVNNNAAGIVEEGGNAIFVFDQLPSNKVIVNGAQMQSAGFIVIHEDEDGTPGSEIGSSKLLPAGMNNSIEIELPQEANDGTTFIAMLHQDDGDGVFDIESDTPLKDSLGNPIQGVFQMNSDATPPADVSY